MGRVVFTMDPMYRVVAYVLIIEKMHVDYESYVVKENKQAIVFIFTTMTSISMNIDFFKAVYVSLVFTSVGS